MHIITVAAGAKIFRIGDPSDAVYIVEDGEIAISVGDDVEVARLHAGELFGESGVLEARPRAATATAMRATKLLVTDGDSFSKAFGMDNERALSLVKLLCARLRSTTQRNASQGIGFDIAAQSKSPIRLVPAADRLVTDFGMEPVDVLHLPFQVGNRYGGETVPLTSNRACCIAARGDSDLAAPHFEILKRDGQIGVRDLGTNLGTIINGTLLNRSSIKSFEPLRAGANEVIAGRRGTPYHFHVHIRGK